jgi:hypothetical protein
MPSKRAAILTPSPNTSSPSWNTSPRLTPIRNCTRPCLGQIEVARRHQPLDIDRAMDRFEDADEFRQEPIAGGLEHAAAMLGDLRLDQILT